MLFTLDHRTDISLMDKDLFGGDQGQEEEEDHGAEEDFLYDYNINEN